jgi:hypothetical protein
MNYDELLKQLEDIELPEQDVTLHMKLKTCEVGMFKLPGIVVERPEDWSDENWQRTQEEMDAWADSEHVIP